ncbi:MAG: DUF192 domain-containing protein [Pleurocapsa sp.]
MKLKLNLSIILLILLSGCSTLTSTRKTIVNASEQVEIQQGQMLPITAIAEIGEATIKLEVAQTPEQQAIGLMFRKSLADDRGMLFPFEFERNARFWMKNVPISLDIIFLNGDSIVGIAANVPGCKSDPCPVYGPDALVDKVVELRGGRAEELGIKIDDKVYIKPLNSQHTENSSDS